MLRNLHISNYALIDFLDIDFSEGFSVITGETGAGKSIIMGALGLLLGTRADAKVIKSGAVKCCVEALFDISELHLESFFEEYDIDHLENAININSETIKYTIKGKIKDYDTPIIVYCQSGRRSSQAVTKLNDLGYDEVYDLGSIDNWED